MKSTVTTTTISMPTALARRVKRLSQAESRTASDLFREAFRFYEAARSEKHAADWNHIKAELDAVSCAGRHADLSRFVADDRRSH